MKTGQCFPVGSQEGISYRNPGTCASSDHAVLPGGKTGFPGLVLSASVSVEAFDLLGLKIVNSFPEVLGVPKALLTPGIDPTTLAGYDYIRTNNSWRLIEIDNLHMRGLRGRDLAHWRCALCQCVRGDRPAGDRRGAGFWSRNRFRNSGG